MPLDGGDETTVPGECVVVALGNLLLLLDSLSRLVSSASSCPGVFCPSPLLPVRRKNQQETTPNRTIIATSIQESIPVAANQHCRLVTALQLLSVGTGAIAVASLVQ